MFRIDAHTHCVGDHPQTIALLAELDLKLLNIGVAEEELPWREHLKLYRQLAARHPDRFAWVTTFDLPSWDDPHWPDRVIADLDTDFAAGAVGCKLWKDVGMRARRPDGSYLMVDDAVYQPIFAHLEKIGRPLLLHIAEPLACWSRGTRAPSAQPYVTSFRLRTCCPPATPSRPCNNPNYWPTTCGRRWMSWLVWGAR